MSLALDIENLSVVYGGSVNATRQVSLNVPENSIVSLLGANGAGKTSALKAVTGLLQHEKGKATGDVEFFGEQILNAPAHKIVRKGLFHCREGRQIFDDLTVEENLTAATFATQQKVDREEIFSLFPRLKERRSQTAGLMSGGEQQMLAIARALVAAPKMILLDEPSLGLAPKAAAEVFETLKRINQQNGIAVLLVEQNASAALSISQYAYVLENGRVVLEGNSEELSDNKTVQEAYLGINANKGGGQISFKFVKHYRSSKRWAS